MSGVFSLHPPRAPVGPLTKSGVSLRRGARRVSAVFCSFVSSLLRSLHWLSCRRNLAASSACVVCCARAPLFPSNPKIKNTGVLFALGHCWRELYRSCFVWQCSHAAISIIFGPALALAGHREESRLVRFSRLSSSRRTSALMYVLNVPSPLSSRMLSHTAVSPSSTRSVYKLLELCMSLALHRMCRIMSYRNAMRHTLRWP